ncbi:MAG: sigma-70 family RNA polymerase sigma factor [Bryobacterales bacterium]|nr:sigma-70 family RNA polymerase sigma factor [Bryobacterales bacterium]
MAESVTLLLRQYREGDPDALEQLTPLVYSELRSIAARFLRNERRNHTLQTTALAHEAYIKLVNPREFDWRDRAHFFAVAARVIRHILVDHARGRLSAKRGGQAVVVPLEEVWAVSRGRLEEFLAYDELLSRLGELDPRALKVVEMRLFGGLSVEEAAAVLGVSERTVKRAWGYGRAWLRKELRNRTP